MIRVLSDEVIKVLLSTDEAYRAVRDVFIGLAKGNTRNFPIVREEMNAFDGVFGIKSGFEPSRGVLGLKAGGYWPSNNSRLLENHQSTILLFDPRDGKPTAVLGGNRITELRSAATAALSIELLARPESSVLGVVGAGTQALPHIVAALKVRPFRKVIIWNRHIDRARAIGDHVDGVKVTVAETLSDITSQADVIVTVTSARNALIELPMIRPGTHLACTGADTIGKQEIDIEIVGKAAVYVDSMEQAFTLGECQHAGRLGLISPDRIRGTLGEALAGLVPGRQSDAEITLFDSTGLGLHDVALAEAALRRANATGLGVGLPL